MSLGAEMAGIKILHAVEKDTHACATFQKNFPNVEILNINITEYKPHKLPPHESIVFGGPPCQGFSTSNQRTRSVKNPENWMFKEFIRVVKFAKPEWVVFENVKGLLETERGLFLNLIIKKLSSLGYTTSYASLNANDYGVPQIRRRLFVVGNKNKKIFQFPKRIEQQYTVRDAIDDLPTIDNGALISRLPYATDAHSDYARFLRCDSGGCANNLTTKSAPHIIARYEHVPPGGNWKDIPTSLMENYKDRERCHTGIYHRLLWDQPSVVLGNFRKNMLIHPEQNRGLSVREAARIQSFPDHFEFCGSIGFQQQQVGNAVPPLLAKSLFQAILNSGE